MEEIIQNTLEWIGERNIFIVWPFIFFSNFLENVFPPWPGDTITAFSGFMAAKSKSIGLVHIVTATYLGNLFGGLLMYYSGKRLLEFIRNHDLPFKKSFFDEKQLEKTIDWFDKYSIFVVVFSRFSAGIRFFVSIVAGISHMKTWKFIFCFSIAIFLWCGLLLGGGFYLGQNWNYIVKIIGLYNQVIIILFILILSGIIIWKWKFSKETI